jgi:crotonobetainyl-CoA:carnitine CoA-transferase CaiB-like acyl-CoA transferase
VRKEASEMNILDGVRILDLTQMLAGPYGSLVLADMGAEVIKIEEPKVGDRTRTMAPHFFEGESAYFISINRNKKSLTLNLKSEKGREIFYELVKESDVVFDNFRPGTLERLGCDYETIKKINPKIISCSLSAFGENGPYRDMPAFDLSIQAMGGAMSITGEPDGAPVRMGIPMGDIAGGMFAALAISSALYSREKSGKGVRIDLGLLDSIASLLTYVAQYYLVGGEIPKPIGSAHQSVVPYQAFKTRDIYIVIAIFTEKFWIKLCSVMGLGDLIEDERFSSNEKRSVNRKELIPILEKKLLEKSGEEWIELFNKEGVPCAPINTVDKVLADEQIKAREMAVDVSYDSKKLRMLGNPVKVEGMKREYVRAPFLGEHTEEILKTMLGYSGEKIKTLKDEGIIS